MLASSGPLRPGAAYAFEPKLDGWRAVVHVTGTGVSVYTRPGREIARLVPELAALADVVLPGTVLDGELVVGSGRPWSFYRLGTLMATNQRGRQQDATFVAFDLLAVEGRAVTGQPYEERRRLLEDLRLAGPAWCTVCQWADESLTSLLEVCERCEIEGLVGKRLGSRYKPGDRSVDWVKLKTTAWRAQHGPHRHR